MNPRAWDWFRGKITAAPETPDIITLLAALKDRDPSARARAAHALGERKDPAAFESLVDATHDEDERVRTEARWSLQQMGWTPSETIEPDDPGAEKTPLRASPEEKGAARNLHHIPIATVHELIPLLRDPDPEKRRITVQALGDLGDFAAIEPLLQALADLDPTVQKSARKALERLGWAPEASMPLDPLERGRYLVARKRWSDLESMGEDAVNPLIESLGDTDKYIRWRAARTLGRVGTARAVEPLMKALRDPDPGVRKGIRYALEKLVGEHLIEPLDQVLNEENDTIRLEAAGILGSRRDARIITPLTRILSSDLQNPDSGIRALTSEILEKLTGRPVPPGEQPGGERIEVADQATAEAPPAFTVLPDSIGGDASPTAVMQEDLGITSPLADQPQKDAMEPEPVNTVETYPVETLIGMLEDPDQEVRLQAIIYLGLRRDPSAVAPLAQILIGSSPLRASVAGALGEIGDRNAAEALLGALNDRDEEVRTAAGQALEKCRDEESIQILVGALGESNEEVLTRVKEVLVHLGPPVVERLVHAFNSRNPVVRGRAADVLVAIGSPSVDSLIRTLEDPSDLVRWRAARALGEIADPRAVGPLIEALGTNDLFLRRDAADALYKMGGKAMDPLVQALREGQPGIRKEVAGVLGRIGDQRAVEGLRAVLDDPSSEIRCAAIWALGELGGAEMQETLLPYLQDPDRSVSSAVKIALNRLSRKTSWTQ